MKKLPIFLITSALLSCTAYGVQADTGVEHNDAAAVTSAPISLSDALHRALAQVPGQASAARFEMDDGHPRWQVEVVTTRGVVDLALDADTGEVLYQGADPVDRGGEQDD